MATVGAHRDGRDEQAAAGPTQNQSAHARRPEKYKKEALAAAKSLLSRNNNRHKNFTSLRGRVKRPE